MKSGLIRFVAPLLTAVGVSICGLAAASEASHPLDQFPTDKLNDLPALQRGAKLFVNYCLGCHSANSMRYNRLSDLGLTEEQIESNLRFTGKNVGSQMRIPMLPADAKKWFGALPPDMSVLARARSSGAGSGSDWIYTFLRSFYRDHSRDTGWNNALFPNVGMPNVLWQMQGQRAVTMTEIKHAPGGDHAGYTQNMVTYDIMGLSLEKHGDVNEAHPTTGKSFKFTQAVGGQLNGLEFDGMAADITAYLTYMSDPSASERKRLGVWVLIFLSILFGAAWMLNSAFWKDVK